MSDTSELATLRRTNDALRAELKRALEKNEELRAVVLAADLNPDLRESYRLLVERCKRLEDALRYYALAAIYQPNMVDIGVGEMAEPNSQEILRDSGEIAKEALEVKP